MNETSQVSCPNCGHQIDVRNILAHEIEKGFKEKYNSLYKRDQERIREQEAELKAFQTNLEKEKKAQEILVRNKVDELLRTQTRQLEQQLKQKIDAEQNEKLALIEKELQEKSEQIKELHRTKAEMEKLRREKEEMKAVIEADMQKQLNEELTRQREYIKKIEEDKSELRIKELEKKLEDQKKLTEEMKRKQEQGSMQLQGEVMELAIEGWLEQQFPLDTIQEISKGARGGDCIQIVNTREKYNCGTIYYESKRAKNFEREWIEKLKQDIRDKGADIGVLVTQAYPKGIDRMTQIDGIWVCSFDEFKGLCHVLRESMVQIHMAVASQENRGDKMAMLYDFLTGNEFRMQIEAIVEGFTQMQMDLEKEKRAMNSIWKAREKQIEKVLLNTNYMYSSIKGIAGNAIQPIKTLELPGNDEDA